MGRNANLHRAKSAKCDEFYTQMKDIENELVNYRDHLAGKRIYCACDDYRFSNFWKFFVEHFHEYRMKSLTATNYDIGNGSYVAEYDGDEVRVERLDGNGDFRSPECVELLKEADVVVTNPPFSLFRDFVAQLVEYGKEFLIVGNFNVVTYKEIFPMIKDNRMWVGVSQRSMEFVMPNGENGQVNACWFTNLEHKKRSTPIDLYRKYTPEAYPKYDNYSAIEVSKVAEIPMDYYETIGVPITFLDKYCPTQFEIVKFRKGDDDKDLSVNGKCPYFRILIRRISGQRLNSGSTLRK